MKKNTLLTFILAGFLVSLPLFSLAKGPFGVGNLRTATTSVGIRGTTTGLYATTSTTTPAQIRLRIKEMKEQYKIEAQQLKEQFQERIRNLQEEMKTRLEQERERLRVRLENIKDKRKADSVEKINDNLQKLNERWTKHFLDVLDKLSDVLVKITSRTDKIASTQNVDVSKVKNLIETASSTIYAARLRVIEQAGKVYTINVTTEKNLKTDVGKTRQQLHSDLVKLRDIVFNARDSVHEAARELARVSGTTTPLTATSTSSGNNSTSTNNQ